MLGPHFHPLLFSVLHLKGRHLPPTSIAFKDSWLSVIVKNGNDVLHQNLYVCYGAMHINFDEAE